MTNKGALNSIWTVLDRDVVTKGGIMFTWEHFQMKNSKILELYYGDNACHKQEDQVRSVLLNTYIHNWSLQPFIQDYGLASHTTHRI